MYIVRGKVALEHEALILYIAVCGIKFYFQFCLFSIHLHTSMGPHMADTPLEGVGVWCCWLLL